MSAIVEAAELSRWYGIVMGLNHVDFSVSPGITGFVGPNGAGKSTLIQITTGQLRPSSGSLTVFGEQPFNNPKVLGRIGYCPESESVHTDLRPMDWLSGLARLSGIPSGEIKDRCELLLDLVKLPRVHWKKRLGQYSKGMRQRVKLAQALLSKPDLLVLDEPMNGLDPMARQEFSQTLKSLAADGVSIIISSHILAELEALCKRVLIMSWGRVLASGEQKSIRTEIRNWSEQLVVRCDQPLKLAGILFEQNLILGFDINEADSTLSLRIRSPKSFYQRFPQLVRQSGLTLWEMRSQSRSLRNIFDKITQ
ncbi:MAG: putative ABC transporter ATP-binding protein YxlF [Verrucomicrobia subdivision 3 bacterium]|nr:putative ABC transporter ATP-binding protein YxlF [Limisphaerales bacterium]MCS1417458.1 putative ABC transporter ATP-binding protein YxlF [Limisphaerales bacterium]